MEGAGDVRVQGFSGTTVALAVRAAQAGEPVLWIRSTVANVIENWERFRQQGLAVILHHSRYADEDRMWLDAQVLGVIGLRAKGAGW
jgi:hypothetical protein